MQNLMIFVLAVVLIWALFFKDQQPLPKAEQVPVLVPVLPLDRERPVRIIDGDDNVIWERQQ